MEYLDFELPIKELEEQLEKCQLIGEESDVDVTETCKQIEKKLADLGHADTETVQVVLAEIASRALSPAVNDPGTAIDVLGRLVRVLSRWELPAEPAVSVRSAIPGRVLTGT